MVSWKGNLNDEKTGKAARLDGLSGFEVPNFFVISSEEVSKMFDGSTDSEEVLNSSMDSRVKEEVERAYSDVGMSSEVRQAPGRAKNLVEGQRNGQPVSVRISDGEKEQNKYELNVTSSNLFDAIQKVVSSYYSYRSNHPSIIVQKMVDPGFSGVLEIKGSNTLIEAVKGIGSSLEEGITRPHVIYLDESGGIQEVLESEDQIVLTHDSVTGEDHTSTEDTDIPFSKSEVKKLSGKAQSQGLNIKFVYKRGVFHVVDAYRGPDNSEELQVSSQGIRVSQGSIQGVLGEDLSLTRQTAPPSDYKDALISAYGGYTSRDAFYARLESKPAIFRFKGDVSEGDRVNIDEKAVSPNQGQKVSEKKTLQNRSLDTNQKNSKYSYNRSFESVSGYTATKVLPINPQQDEGVFIENRKAGGYIFSDNNSTCVDIPEKSHITSFKQVLGFEGDLVLLDVRDLRGDAVAESVRYISANRKFLLVENPSKEVLYTAIKSGFDVVGCPEDYIEPVSSAVARSEKKFILDKLRSI